MRNATAIIFLNFFFLFGLNAELPKAGLEKEVIHGEIQKHSAEVRQCYEDTLVLAPKTMGKLSLTFTISHNGTVLKCAVKENRTGSKEVGECLVKVCKEWVFPTRGANTVVGEYPFFLKPEKRFPSIKGQTY